MNDAKTIGSNALVLDTAEENVTVMNAEESKLGKEVSLIEQRAEAVVVASGADFEDAGLFLKQIKQAQKQVKDYWEPLRVSAKKSYDEVLNHRKEMIEPLEKAEKIVKTKVNEYTAVNATTSSSPRTHRLMCASRRTTASPKVPAKRKRSSCASGKSDR